MELEESTFYPYFRETTGEESLVEEALVEHQSAKELIAEIRKDDSGPHETRERKPG